MSDSDKLFQMALKAQQNAYAPYSKFQVGAALQSNSGQIYVGANVENIAYPLGTCAEAGAIAAMVVGGDKKIKEIVIIADSQPLITPCGGCLQRIKEFSTSQTLIHLANLTGIQKTYTLQELLPNAFTF